MDSAIIYLHNSLSLLLLIFIPRKNQRNCIGLQSRFATVWLIKSSDVNCSLQILVSKATDVEISWIFLYFRDPNERRLLEFNGNT